MDCVSLESVVIPDSVTTIDVVAFCNCIKLKEITLPEGITAIGESAFDACWGLRQVDLPDSLSEINASAFNNCANNLKLTVTEGSSAEQACINAGIEYSIRIK